MMQHITFSFRPLHQPLNGRYIYAKALHGLIFNITGQADPEESNWLHDHPSPRPFSLVPLYTEVGTLAGLRLAALTERAAALLLRTGEWFCQTGRPCHLSGREFVIDDVRCTPGPSWQQLANSPPAKQIGVRFLSPTAFKHGPRHLTLPLPRNVFGSPLRLWCAFAPDGMEEPPFEWLDWCEKNLFIIEHRIETVRASVTKRGTFTGFVGEVWYEAHGANEHQRSFWNAMTDLAAFHGVGHKATMGFGALERI